MNIEQRCIQQIEAILISKGNTPSNGSGLTKELEKFFNKIGEQNIYFFPTYPNLPKIKYLLWNHDNLRPELQKRVQSCIYNLWSQNRSKTDAKEEAEPIPVPGKEKPPEDIEPLSTKLEASITPTESESSRFIPKRKQDGFDKLLDFFATLVRVFTFS